MVFAMLACVIVFAIALFTQNRFKSLKLDRGKSYAILTGFATGGVNLLTMFLVSMEKGSVSVMYPIISVGTLLMSMLSGIFVFKEKQTLIRILGFLFGAVAVVLLKI